MAHITFGACSDAGRRNSTNHDAVFTLGAGEYEHLQGLFIVSDGMGKGLGSCTASKLTVQTLSCLLQSVLEQYDLGASTKVLAYGIREGMIEANRTLIEKKREFANIDLMGATCVAVGISQNTLVVGNAGDSRAYLLHEGELRQITRDHIRLMPEGKRQGKQSGFTYIVAKGIGISPELEPEMEMMQIEEGDVILLCSDGLTGMVKDSEITQILETTRTPQEAASTLVECANQHGGADNISTIVVHYGTYTPKPRNQVSSAKEPDTQERGTLFSLFKKRRSIGAQERKS